MAVEYKNSVLLVNIPDFGVSGMLIREKTWLPELTLCNILYSLGYSIDF